MRLLLPPFCCRSPASTSAFVRTAPPITAVRSREGSAGGGSGGGGRSGAAPSSPSQNCRLRRGFLGGPPGMGQCVSRREKGREWWGDAESPARETATGCLALAREQRSRLYIIRKCVMMLLCWHKYGKY